MLKTHKKIIRFTLLLLIFTLGIFSDKPDCYGLISSLCLQVKSLGTTGETANMTCMDDSCGSASLSFSKSEEGFCCKENTCDNEIKIVYGNQDSKVQKHPNVFVIGNQIPNHKYKKTYDTLDHYKFSKTTPLYILTQSFLC